MNFRYQALNAEGRLIAGELQAESVSQAVVQLESSGLRVQSISLAEAHSPVASGTMSAAHMRNAAVENHLRTAIERGKTIAPALRAYAEELPTGRRKRELARVLAVLEHGNTSRALDDLNALPAWWIPLLASAAKSLDPGRMLQEFLNESRRAEELRRQWWLSLAYPLFVACLAAAVLTALSILVIPIFRDIFLSFGLRLPGLTSFVLAVSHWIASGRILLDAALFAVVLLLLFGTSKLLPSSIRDWFSDRFERLLGRRSALARFSQFLADLLEADLDAANAVRLAGLVTPSRSIRRAASQLAEDWEAGRRDTAAAQRPILSATILHALTSDLPPGGRTRLLTEISVCHAEAVRRRYSWTRGIVEPVAIVVVGALVGLIVLALFMPLLSLLQGLT